MSAIDSLQPNASAGPPIRRSDGVWLVGVTERAIAILFPFVITGAVVRLMLQAKDADLLARSSSFAKLMAVQATVADTSALGRLFSLPIYIVVLGVVLISWPRIWLELRHNKLAVALVVLTFASTLWSVNPSASFRSAAGLALCTSFAIYLALRFGREELFRLLAISFLAMAILSLVFVAALPSRAIMADHSWRGIFTHKNSLGAIMAWGIVVCAAAAISTQHRRLALGSMPILAVPLFFSNSMTAVVSTVVVLTTMGTLWACHRVRTLVPLLVSAVVCAVGVMVLTNALPSDQVLSAAVNRNTSLTGRTELWQAVVWWIEQRFWLGYGYDGFWTSSGYGLEIQRVIGWPTPSSHNGLLDAWLGLGFVGVSVLLGFLARVAVRAVAGYRTPAGICQVACFGVLIMSILENATESVIPSNNIEWLLMISVVTVTQGIHGTAPHAG